jgi:DNA polymerase-3 subunit delta'
MDRGEFHFIGNRSVVERLRTKLEGRRLPHGLLFSGPPGVGKHTCAVWIAQALNCAAPDPTACLECSACRRIAEGTFSDVSTVTLEADASQIKIAQVRDLRSRLSMEPLEGRATVVIIDPAEAMSPGAANALLKSLEEPPSTAYFFLITANAHELLPTIRSRSQTYHFSPLTLEEVRLSGVTDEFTLRWAQGSVGLALEAEPVALRRDRDQMLQLLEHALGADPTALAALIGGSGKLGREKDAFDERLRMLSVLVRDVLLFKEGLAERLINIDVRDRVERLAGRTDIDALIEVYEQLKFVEANLKYHLNRDLMADGLILAMAGGS